MEKREKIISKRVIHIKNPILHRTLEKLINDSICRFPDEIIVQSDHTQGKKSEMKQIRTHNNEIFHQKDM